MFSVFIVTWIYVPQLWGYHGVQLLAVCIYSTIVSCLVYNRSYTSQVAAHIADSGKWY